MSEAPPTSLPLDFPPLVELATKAVHEFETVTASPPDRWACAMLLRDLTRRDSQALWLEWLAREVGMELPPVGTLPWTRLEHHIVQYRIGEGGADRLFVFDDVPAAWRFAIRCPALPNPDAPDAPIRALALAVLTVGSRGER